ncbi:MAG: phosphoribosylformylglycinamidine synthase subunit PurL [Phycisphaerales bacterium]
MTTTEISFAVHRIEVHPRNPADDPVGRSVLHEAREMNLAEGLRDVRSARVYLIEAALDDAALHRIAGELLADPINQRYIVGASKPGQSESSIPGASAAPGSSTIEVHYLPGVMDPVAQSTADAIREMLAPGNRSSEAAADKDPNPQSPAPSPQSPVPSLSVQTGFRYDFLGIPTDQAQLIAQRLLSNPVVQHITTEPFHPAGFRKGTPYQFKLTHIALRDLDDDALKKMSREAHLFLSLDEMKAVQQYFRARGSDPTDIELETLAQTWSEHCVHKTLKSRISYKADDAGDDVINFRGRPGHTVQPDGTVVIDNLLKSTIAAATHRLTQVDGIDWCISVFKDNAGIIRFDESDAVTFKVETHNHPSAIEPYGGAATGIGGCIRDTMGTGLCAKPIANTDTFCVAHPDRDPRDLPKGVLHPKRILKQIVAGVRDYGNRMGIPTVNGAVYFDDRYLGNPLVFAGSVGLIPRDKCFGSAKPGDRIIALGGRTGRDGIHGATFSSAELTDTHACEFSHAVQIGNAITEKKTLDVILQARDPRKPDGSADEPLYHAITDCGAGGFSSACGEMGSQIGAFVQLEQAPLKYAGLSYTEIWISEAQERMVLAVPPEKVPALAALCDAENVECCDLGYFGTENAELILTYDSHEVGRMAMHFLHEGLPQLTRQAEWHCGLRIADCGLAKQSEIRNPKSEISDALLALLAHPNIASKHWIVRQYDHEVQGGSVIKPLVGPRADGPSDAAVLRPKLDTDKAIALSNGLATMLGDIDPYWMTLAAIDEAVRNAVCVGADPTRIAILDNFCWASCDDPRNLGSLVRAAEACYDGAIAYKTPFISGKDSLNNQFTTESGQRIAIPPTLLISAIAIVENIERCLTMDAKQPGNLLLQIGITTESLGASHYAACGFATPGSSSLDLPRVNLQTAPHQLATVASLIHQQLLASAHDCSEGGLLVAASEMAFAGNLGLSLNLHAVPRDNNLSDLAACFAETPSRILVEVTPDNLEPVIRILKQAAVPFGEIGCFNDSAALTVRSHDAGRLLNIDIEKLRTTWRKPLDW